MKSKTPLRRRLHHLSLLILLALWQIGQPLQAANLTWDITPGNGASITGGTGTWTNGLGNWNTGAGDTTWHNATPDAATFGGTAGTVMVNGSQVAGIRLFGGSGAISTTFNKTVSAAGKYFATSAIGQTVNIGGSFTASDF